ncbi:MAG: hypothetical protein AAB458_01780 [Patescibacteria group bacterium]
MFELDGIASSLTSTKALWWLWALFAVGFILLSAVLTYHWRPYYALDPHVKATRLVHHIGGSVLLIIAAALLFFA